jgi:hypothetical protein
MLHSLYGFGSYNGDLIWLDDIMLACIGVIENSESIEWCLASKAIQLDHGMLVHLSVKEYLTKVRAFCWS